ncbi:MAG: beta-L-arabinofuranosidase domain-containing protein [Candidatus Aminicenantales bacterium]
MKKFITLLTAAALAVFSTGCSKDSRPAPKTIELGGTAYAPGADYPIQPKRFSEVTLEDDFWKPKIERNAAVTIPHVLERTKSANALQAALYALQTRPDPGLQAQVDSRIQEILAAQKEKPAAGNGLFELAADTYTSTGKKDLLDSAVRTADTIYRLQQAEHPPFSGGERDAVNCIQLYRATGDKKHLDLAKYYLDIRGLENSTNRSRHNQSHQPVLEQTEAVGHAVNDATLMLSLADVGALTGVREYSEAAERLWRDTVGTKLYITGGIGSTGNEGFGKPYALPNHSAYCETCAGIMFAAFNHRMFLATGDSKYIDVLERAIYNNVIDGVSASGNRFFYVNRLASAGDGRDLRWEWASLPCCPPNLVRFLASMPGYIYAQDKDGIYVNLYVSGKASFRVGDKDLALAVRSEMPWGGASEIVVSAADNVRGNIRLRIPGWARNRPVPGDLYTYLDKDEGRIRVSVNGTDSGQAVDPSGYVSLNRTWKDGDVVRIEFPFNVRKVVAHPSVKDDRGRMAVERGPIVYCAEGPECEDGHALGLLWNAGSELKPSFDESLFGGIHIISGEARNISRPSSEPRTVKLIPYHLWANRGAGEMSVWQSTAEYALGDTGPAGGLIFYVNPNSAADGWRYLEAAPRDQSEGAPWGCFRTAIPGADGAAVGTGRKNTLDMLAACPDPGSAAALCANYTLNGFDDWFLPSIDELVQMYLNLKVTGACDFGDAGIADNVNYWSSTQVTADMARHLDFADNGLRRHYDDKDYPRRVRAIRAF